MGWVVSGECAAVAQYGQVFAAPGVGLPARGREGCARAGVSIAIGAPPSHIGIPGEGTAMATCITVERTEAYDSINSAISAAASRPGLRNRRITRGWRSCPSP